MDQWNRWIFASLAKYFKELTGVPPTIFIEHLDERTPALMAASDTAEVRITGPYIQQQGSGEYRVRMTVNVLLTSRFDGVTKNAYKILDYAGIFVEAMKGPIPIYQMDENYTEENKENLFLGCMSIPNGQSIMSDNYGGIDTTDRVKASEIEAKYEGVFTDE